MRKLFLIWGLILIFLVGFLSWNFFNKNEILSPLVKNKAVIKDGQRVKVVGFLPTWMVEKTVEYTNEIDVLVFLGIEVDSKGNLVWEVQSKKINNKTYLNQKELIWENGGQNVLGIKLFEDEKLNELMNSEMAQDNLINQLIELWKTDKFDGINVDFEYQGDPTAILSEKMVNFLNKLKQADFGEISLDVFANTIIKGDQVKLNNLIGSVDSLIVMAYDFHRPGVDFTGSVAPINSNPGERNIMEIVEKIITLNLDKKKIIMAYPLYGYEWKTDTKDFESKIKRGWYQMASWNRSKEIIREKQIETFWDELSMTPWLVFEEEGEIHQIYYENDRSLKIKLDLVKQNQLGGVGFWALGYEGEENIWSF